MFFAVPPMITPAKRSASATRRTSLRPNTCESEAKIGWKIVEARRKLVARLKVAVVLLLSDSAIA